MVLTALPVADDPNPHDTFDLIQRHLAGDPDALGMLIQRYYPALVRIVRVRLGLALRTVETVEDVVQDVLVRILEGIESYQPKDDADWIDWAAGLAQNEIRNHARRDRAQKRGGGLAARVKFHADSATSWDIPAQATGVQSAAERRELRDLLDQHLAGLADPHREVILLREYAHGEWRMVAERMGRSVEACQELHRRARIELGKRMRGKG